MRRILLIIVLMIMIAPGTWLRSEAPYRPPIDITLSQVMGAADEAQGAWRRMGVWEYSADNYLFGGYSALIALPDDKLIAFSDRGMRFSLIEPDKPQPKQRPSQAHHPAHNVKLQRVPKYRARWLWDIESATRDPDTGEYWLGFENTHAIHSFDEDHEAQEVRLLTKHVDWTVNSGAEAMTRLSDGRFVLLPEGKREGLIFPDDPTIKGGEIGRFPYRSPVDGFAVVDMVQLPDGRLLLLLRNLVWGLPPFDSLLAVTDPPVAGQEEPLTPKVVLDLEDLVPAENYEGVTYKERAEGTLDVWIISDDNRAAIQRTLLAKLRLDPALLDQPEEKPAKVERPSKGQAKQKARE
ncbi:MAG: esterase-like activity of phytase family protein [Pseudomonadota bacterium]|nr:esterase-like activity of phytase family protein [Pseudomonadota bacterium]